MSDTESVGLSAFARRSIALGQRKAFSYAQGNRTYQVLITRPVGPPGFSRAAGEPIPAETLTVYRGRARVTPFSPSQIIDLGDVQASFGAVRVSIPYCDEDPRIDDEVKVLVNPMSQLARMAGKRFRVTGVTEGGAMTVGYSMDAVGVRPSMYVSDADG